MALIQHMYETQPAITQELYQFWATGSATSLLMQSFPEVVMLVDFWFGKIDTFDAALSMEFTAEVCRLYQYKMDKIMSHRNVFSFLERLVERLNTLGVLSDEIRQFYEYVRERFQPEQQQTEEPNE